MSRCGQSFTLTARTISLDKGLKSTYPRRAILSNLFKLTPMSDIFLSYATEDRKKAAQLAAIFKREGWTVWWNRRIPVGQNYAEVIEAQLTDALFVVVLWSQASVTSQWVRTEVAEANDRGVLLPVLIEPVRIPLAFLHIQVVDLTDWRAGADAHAGLKKLLSVLHFLIDTPSAKAARPASLKGRSPSKVKKKAKPAAPREGAKSRPKGGRRFEGVFISYRRNEAAAYAGRLYDRLTARFGRERVFIDTENVGRGADFVEAITDAAESCAVMIALISRQWARATGGEQDEEEDYVRLEVAAALGRKIPLIPIMIQGASMPRAKELPDDLAPIARRNAFELRDARWERDVEDLILDLEKLLKN
jgi:hypothetical protein